MNPTPHHQRTMRKRLAAVSSLALLATLLAGAPASAGDGRQGREPAGTTSVVATGLNSPRQLSFAPGGSLYVAEAGTGGPAGENCVPMPAFQNEDGCLGFTGSVARVSDKGTVKRVVRGLPSVAGPGESVGPFDVAFTGRNQFAVSIGLGGSPSLRAQFGDDGRLLGTIATGDLRYERRGVRLAFDAAQYEAENDWDGGANGDVDSNPTGLAVSGSGWVYTDAGGNQLVSTRRGGSTLATLDPVPTTQPGPVPVGFAADAVPTDVVKGPDGAWYVSQLVGFPFEKGSSTIWKVRPGRDPVAYATGLTNVTALAFSGKTLYAVELSTNGLLSGPVGALRKITPGASEHAVVAGGLNQPYGLAIRGKYAYVTLGAINPIEGGGSVVKVRL